MQKTPSPKTPVILKRSPRSDKKWLVKVDDKNVNFGQEGYQDFTMHKNEERQNNYINRHRKNENWGNWFTPGFWSRWLLWNKPTLKESIESIESQFPIKIIQQDDGGGGMMMTSSSTSQMMIIDENNNQYNVRKTSRRRKKSEEAVEEVEEEEKVEVKKKNNVIMSKSRKRKNGKEIFNKIEGKINDKKDEEMLKRIDDILSSHNNDNNFFFPRLQNQ
jgi:hypothetical protein